MAKKGLKSARKSSGHTSREKSVARAGRTKTVVKKSAPVKGVKSSPKKIALSKAEMDKLAAAIEEAVGA